MVLRQIPVNIYDLAQVEAYFSYMAERGLFLKKVRGFAVFNKGKNEITKYRLYPFGESAGNLNEELRLQFQNGGWEYICKLSNSFFVFKAIGEETKEFPLNPLEWKKNLEKIRHKCRIYFVCALIYFLLCLGMFLYLSFFTDYPIYYAIESNISIVIPISIFWGFELIKKYIDIKQLNQYLLFGSNYGDGTLYKPIHTSTILNRVSILLFFLSVLILVYGHLVSWEKDLKVYQDKIPTISLATIETNPNLETEIFDNEKKILKNTISFEWTALAPKIYKIQENGILEESEKDMLSTVYTPAIDSEVYNLRFQFLVLPFLKDNVKFQMDLFHFEDIQYRVLENTKFDQAYFCYSKNYQGIFASVGKKVICVDYFGHEDLSNFTTEIYQAVANS